MPSSWRRDDHQREDGEPAIKNPKSEIAALFDDDDEKRGTCEQAEREKVVDLEHQ